MFTLLKMTVMLVLTTTGMEIATTDVAGVDCVFNYEQMMPRLMEGLDESQKITIKVLAQPYEGMACGEIPLQADKMLNEIARKYD